VRRSPGEGASDLAHIDHVPSLKSPFADLVLLSVMSQA
jgi:hypothetical protein